MLFAYAERLEREHQQGKNAPPARRMLTSIRAPLRKVEQRAAHRDQLDVAALSLLLTSHGALP